MGKDKKLLKEILGGLIAKGIAAVAKLVKSKLLPKAEEKYCKVLQAATEKIADKVATRVADLKTAEGKKRIKDLYLLKLIYDTLNATSESLVATAQFIKDNVDFSEIEEPTEEALVALAEVPGALENDGECGPDGCEIA